MEDSFDRSAVPSRIGGLEQLGRYELVCVMSRAEYGSTWACIATSAPNLGKIFSLRRIVVASGDEDKVTKALTKTAADWEGVTRPGLVPIVDCVESAGRVGIVSDYVEGEPLRTVLNLAGVRKITIPQPVAFRIVTDLVQALVNLLGAALKKPDLAKTMHGGLLPDVVLLTASGETRISEPGVTAEIVGIPTLVQHEKLIAYLTPEQLSGGKVDARTDVFALGVILWEILAGKGLFLAEDEGRTSDTVRKRVADLEAPRLDDPLLAIQPPVDKALADAVERALEKQPSDRFPSLQDFATALRKAVGTKAGTRKDVASFLSGLIGSTIDTRRAAIERASLGADARTGHSSQDPKPAAADMDIDFGDGDDFADDLDEVLLEPTGEHARPPTPPPRVDIRPAKPPRPGGVPRPQGSPQPPVVAPVLKVDAAPEKKADEVPEETSKEEKPTPDSAGEKPSGESLDIPPPSAVVLSTNPFEQPFETPAAPEDAAESPLETATESAPPSDVTPPPPGFAETPAPAFGEPFETESPDDKSAEPPPVDAALPVIEGDPEKDRKRKLAFIVGGVVGVAALLLIVGVAMSMGGDDDKGSDATPELSATVAVEDPTPTQPEPEPEPEPGPEAGPEPEPEAGPDAQAEAGPEAEPPPEETAKPVAPKVPRPYKPKPKPYVPSGI